jgi:ElaB/YqjD/DUF883 family membrane-anchored ribosome-binding protein
MANSSTKQNRSEFGTENPGSANVSEQAKGMAETVKDKARQAGEYVRDKAGQAGEFVREKAEAATSSAGKGMETLAGQIRERGPQSGMLGRATSGVADTLDRTGRYLEDTGFSGMMEDVTSLVRNHPLPAVLVGIGLGFLLARLTTSSRG